MGSSRKTGPLGGGPKTKVAVTIKAPYIPDTQANGAGPPQGGALSRQQKPKPGVKAGEPSASAGSRISLGGKAAPAPRPAPASSPFAPPARFSAGGTGALGPGADASRFNLASAVRQPIPVNPNLYTAVPGFHIAGQGAGTLITGNPLLKPQGITGYAALGISHFLASSAGAKAGSALKEVEGYVASLRTKSDSASALAEIRNVIPQVALDHLAALEKRGTLSRKDAAGNSTLDYLYAASKADLFPGAKARNISNGVLVGKMITTLANPDGLAQVGAGDCVWANLMRDLASTDPVAFAKLNYTLYTKGTASVPGSGAELKLPAPIAGTLGSGASTKEDVLLGSLTDAFPGRKGYAQTSVGERSAALGGIVAMTLRGDEVPVVISNPDGTAHMITVTGVQGPEIRFYDPVDPSKKGTMPAAEFLRNAKAAFLPKDENFGLRVLNPSDKTQVGRRLGGRSVGG
ncbi:MAG: hypothetical protein FJZ00_02320 [Candidatus Sericytochromatia bacterium]|uniref:Uncharacterized protein n=1 Tax=Candidatus Tanganyikabacteria bacterium TaxID=2961651 RepID=A0A937X5G2_9BACT|nr:hypothetical protein [Candidatus Tanganyikabacteria bacterium]